MSKISDFLGNLNEGAKKAVFGGLTALKSNPTTVLTGAGAGLTALAGLKTGIQALRGSDKKTPVRDALGKLFAKVVGVKTDKGTEVAVIDGDKITKPETGEVVNPADVKEVHLTESDAKELAAKGAKVESDPKVAKNKYVDLDGDFIDDKTGKYIWVKQDFETMWAYLCRLMNYNTWTLIFGWVLVIVVGVLALIYGIIPFFKWVWSLITGKGSTPKWSKK